LTAELLSALVANIEKNRPRLNGSGVANMLFELRGLSSELAVVRTLLRFLDEQLASSKFSWFTGKEIVKALYGLQNMSDELAEVRNILRTFTAIISHPTCELKPAYVTTLLCNLRAMNSSSSEVSDMADILSSKLPNRLLNRELTRGTAEKLKNDDLEVMHGTQPVLTCSFKVRNITIDVFTVAATILVYSSGGRVDLLHPHLADISDIVSLSVRNWSAMELSASYTGLKQLM
jgi:hypothetical protein